MIEVVNLAQKYSLFSETWSPKIAGDLNGQMVKLAKLKGEFVWHHHDLEDELFLVVHGRLGMRLREPGIEERLIFINEGEFVIIPRGVEHLPVAEQEVQVLLLEPAATLNTGNVQNERTKEQLDRI
jgi:mannose-6-phosphate isomerase-like protein (cupin superfamily)